MRILFSACLALSLALACAAVGAPTPPPVVPFPQSFVAGSERVQISSALSFETGGATNELLEGAFDRYLALMFPRRAPAPEAGVLSVRVAVADLDDAPPQLGTDESYSLLVEADSSEAQIEAKTVYGAMRALETLSQLVRYSFDERGYFVQGCPIQIADFPRYSHRGLLVDSVRHYLSLPTLFELLDSMSAAKLNVMHWHVTDTEAFTVETSADAFPLLWQSAIDGTARYTRDDVEDVISYATARGIRVLPEFDVPGHFESACVSYPEVCPDPLAGVLTPLDPTKNETFALLSAVIADLAGLFVDGHFHIGGDEVLLHHWSETPHIQAWMDERGWDVNDTYLYMVTAAANDALASGRTPIGWIETFDYFGDRLVPETVVDVWKAKESLQAVVAAGYQGILSDFDQWYLSQPDITWEMAYMNEPTTNITDPDQQALILGGEACVWGEQVDGSDLLSTVWPRAAAVAERLWSSVKKADVNEFQPRLQNFRCLLNLRGLSAAPVLNAVAREGPPQPGSCFAQ